MAGKDVLRLAAWREAWAASTGPRRPGQALLLALKGFAMGGADIVPGVSGGTIAFITNIYEQLIHALRAFDAGFAGRLVRGDLTGALAASHLRFLAPLGAGIFAALLLMSRFIHHALETWPVLVWSFFFGLIAASIVVVARRIGRFTPGCAAGAAAGAAAAWFIAGLIPVATPETWWFVMFCGALAICAMILPGVSGAFILLLLGKYEFVTRTLKNPFLLENFVVMLTFAAGCVAGLLSFSRLLDALLRRRHDLTVSVLAGFMAGALRKVWPFKEVLETRMVSGREAAVRTANVLPDAFTAETAQAAAAVLLGLVLVLALDKVSRRTPAAPA
jgi:putative membrane protein